MSVLRHLGCVVCCMVLLAAAFMLSGCSGDKATDKTDLGGQTETPTRQKETPPERKKLATGTQVKLISEEGDFALVETADSKQYYVNLGVVKSRSTAERNQEGFFTHTLSAATEAYSDEPPDELPEPEPRPVEEISNEQLTLNRLYMTEKTHRRIIAPTNKGLFVDEVTGENVFPAYTCNNPQCPKRGTEDDPHLFIFVDRSKLPICFACFDAYKLEGATQRELHPYLLWTRPYKMKETERRVKQLDSERKRAYKKAKKKG